MATDREVGNRSIVSPPSVQDLQCLDFARLGQQHPPLVAYLRERRRRPGQDLSFTSTLDWKDPKALAELSRAILAVHFGIQAWQVPVDRLIPPVPNRFEYLSWVHDLMRQSPGLVPLPITGVDIGTGASCIYALLGHQAFGWNWLASEVDAESFQHACHNVSANALQDVIRVVQVEPMPERTATSSADPSPPGPPDVRVASRRA